MNKNKDLQNFISHSCPLITFMNSAMTISTFVNTLSLNPKSNSEVYKSATIRNSRPYKYDLQIELYNRLLISLA